VPYYMEYYGQNPLLQGKIVCNERLDGLLNDSFKARMNFLIVLGTLFLAIPAGLLKMAVFSYGLLPIFRAVGINRNNSLLCHFPSTIIKIAALILLGSVGHAAAILATSSGKFCISLGAFEMFL
jgi:hypothetical protein